MIFRKEKKNKESSSVGSLNLEHSSGLKSVFSDIHGISRNTLIQMSVVVLMDYYKLARISSDKEEETNSAIAESQTSDS